MPVPSFSAIVLAAGKGTRMRSALPKVMHAIAGFPLLWHVLKNLEPLAPQQITVVLAPGMEAVREAASQWQPNLQFAWQEQQLGTAHAVRCAETATKGAAAHLILYGDTPLIRSETLARLLERLETADLVVLGMRPADPKEYGRLVVDAEGQLEKIVEYKDADASERRIGLCNSGVMAIAGGRLFEWLSKIGHANAKGEYYLTDLVAVAGTAGSACAVIEAPEEELLGINSRAELAEAEAACQRRYQERAMAEGVTLIDRTSVHLAADTRFAPDVVIEPSVFFGPRVTIGAGTHIRAFSHLEGVTIGERCVIGPFARLRPGTELKEDVHVGNFVEIKNSAIGKNSKANHLSYLGDAKIGERSNIGAGTITCNYDGFEKHPTRIGDDVFVGSNSTLIAPASLGDGVIIGAGSVIAGTIAENTLAVSRAPLAQHENGAARFREKHQKP